ncbi:MAG: tetratricopeptide repeat protein [Cyanobacteria bacterium SZAS-4]|nr:tetratricopeptide repeat protein [Cyanobacteria bacterium SZAS-4]
MRAKTAYSKAIDKHEKEVQKTLETQDIYFGTGSVLDSKQFRVLNADLQYAINKAPREAKYYVLRSKVRNEEGDFAGALDDLCKVISLYPHNASYFVLRSDYIWRSGHMCFSNLQKISDPNLRKALEATEVDYKEKADAGYAKLKNLAIVDVNKAIKLDPRSQEAFSLKAKIFENAEKYSQELETLNALVALSPKNASYLSRRAENLFTLREFEKSMSDWNKVTRLEPSNKAYAMRRAWCYFALGDKERALTACDALKLTNEDDDLRTSRGELYFYLKQYNKSLADLLKFSGLSRNGYWLAAVASDYWELGQTDAALTYWHRSITKETMDDAYRFKFLYLYASALLAHGDKKQALPVAEHALVSYKNAVKIFPDCAAKHGIYPEVTPEDMSSLISKARI